MADQNNNNIVPPKNKKPKFNFYWIYAILAVVFISVQIFNYNNPMKEISWGQLEEMLVKQDVEKIVIINKEKAEVFIKEDKIKTDSAYKEFQNKKSFGSSGVRNPEFYYQIGSEEIFHGLM